FLAILAFVRGKENEWPLLLEAEGIGENGSGNIEGNTMGRTFPLGVNVKKEAKGTEIPACAGMTNGVESRRSGLPVAGE
ncbi:MAG: hypothetical protein RMI90_03390, partial [Thermoguttaceae bacterium]|nr:hypothetical protein [Thermoguttaceae bacterium]